MTVQEVMNQVKLRLEINDMDTTDDIVIMFMNQAIDKVFSMLAAAKNDFSVKESIFTDKTAPPSDYLKACGQYGFNLVGGIVNFFDGSTSKTVRYFFKPVTVVKTLLTAKIDAPDTFCRLIASATVIYILAANKTGVADDKVLDDEVEKLVVSVS